MNELNPTHSDIVNDYIKSSKEGKVGHYMITVSRDGESGLTLNMTSTPEQTRQFINE